MDRSPAPSVAVIGGGLSGQRAALSLARAGRAVTLFEKGAKLGGRVFSFDDPQFGEIDIGHHVWLRCCRALERFIGDLGVPESELYRQDDFAIPYRFPGGASFTLRASALPFPFHLAPGFAKFPGLSWGDRAQLALGMLHARLMGADTLERMDEMTFARWLAEHDQPAAAIERLWEPLILSVCNQRVAEVSARHALFTFRESLLHSRHAADIRTVRVPLGAIFDRRARVALAEAGVRVRAGCIVRAVAPGRPARVDWRNPDGTRESAEFSAVILAVPAGAAAGICPGFFTAPPPPPDAAIAGLLVKFPRPVMDEPFIAALDSPIQWVFNKSLLRGETGPAQTLEIVISGAGRECAAGGAAVTAELLPALRALFPAAAGADVLATRFIAHRAATFTMPPGGEANRPAIREIAPGLFPAGDHAATGWPSTMESAVRAGALAARALLERDG